MSNVFRSAIVIRSHFSSIFPNLTNTRWLIKSPKNDEYQCIAWAACYTNIRWWPDKPPYYYWPIDLDDHKVPDHLDNFVKAFTALGYRPCDKRRFEFGYQKVAIYATSDKRVKHMARQQFFGRGWLSKCGGLEDILHADLKCIEGDPSPVIAAIIGSYGAVEFILSRSWWRAVISLCLLRSTWAALRHWLYRLGHPSWMWSNLSSSLGKR